MVIDMSSMILGRGGGLTVDRNEGTSDTKV